MLTNFFRILTVSALAFLVQASSAMPTITKDDLIPWPWGTECPFDWKNIEGQWTSRQRDNPERYAFELKGTFQNGTRVLEIRRYNEDEILIGIGEGVTARGEKIVRAAMVGVGPEEDSGNYWAIIRTYVEAPRQRSCTRGKQVTVVTLRSSEGLGDSDTHVIIDKEIR